MGTEVKLKLTVIEVPYMQIKKSYLLLCSLLLLAVPYKIRAEELFDGTQGILSSEEISSGLTSFDPGDAVETAGAKQEALPEDATDPSGAVPEAKEEEEPGTQDPEIPDPTVTPTPTPEPEIPLTGPVITGCYNSVNGADIRWTKVADADGYIIYRSRSAEGTVMVDTIFGADILQYYDESIREDCWGRVYVYQVVAFNGFSPGAESNEVTLQRLAPMTFTGYTSPSAGSVTLQWNVASGSNKAEGYELQYASSKTDLYNQTGSFRKLSISGRNSLSKSLSGLSKSTAYYFRIRGYVNYTHSVTKKTTKTWSQYSDVISITPSGNTATKYRALLVGNYDYAGFSNDLYGPPNDVKAIGGMLKNYNYTVTTKKNRTASQVYNDIASTFKSATVNDVSLFFYSGHGDEDSGSLVGIDDSDIYMKELAARLKKIPGKVVIILDSCGSGNSIYNVGDSNPNAGTDTAAGPNTEAESADDFDPQTDASSSGVSEPDTFNQYVIDVFSQADPGLDPETGADMLLSDGSGLAQVGLGELRVNKFYVLTASDAFQSSSDLNTTGQGWGGALSKGVVTGAGCSFPSGSFSGLIPADLNFDKKLTLKELYNYSRVHVSLLTAYQRYPQTVKCYPANSGQVIMIKK